jgi:hypothetical protein
MQAAAVVMMGCRWEHDHLRRSKAIMFWFPSETLCPITLYELGAWTILARQTGTKLFVGAEPHHSLNHALTTVCGRARVRVRWCTCGGACAVSHIRVW